jgi:hypothetical protein
MLSVRKSGNNAINDEAIHSAFFELAFGKKLLVTGKPHHKILRINNQAPDYKPAICYHFSPSPGERIFFMKSEII